MVVLAPIIEGDEALSTTAQTLAAMRTVALPHVWQWPLRRMVLVDRT